MTTVDAIPLDFMERQEVYLAERSLKDGYINVPVENRVRLDRIRDCCQRNGLQYVLSATEYVMDDCYTMLDEVLCEAPRLESIVLCSLLMLPIDRNRQAQVYHRVFAAGAPPYGALESLPIRNGNEIAWLEDIWDVKLLTWQPGPSVPGVRVQEGRV